MEQQEVSLPLLKELVFSQPEMKNHFDSSHADEGQNSYAIVNGAGTDKVMMNLVAYEPEHRNLYYPEEAGILEDASPWLVKLEKDEPFTEWLLEECFNERLLLFVQSRADIDTLASHFRYYTKAEIPNADGWEIAYFSFYDPTIFSTWAKSLTQEEATQFFQPITNVWYEEGNNNLTLLYMAQDGWKHKTHSLVSKTKKTEKNKKEKV